MTAVAVQPAIRKGPSSMRVFHDTWLVFRRSLGLTVRQPAWLIAGVMQPFVYLILFGPLLDSLSSPQGDHHGRQGFQVAQEPLALSN